MLCLELYFNAKIAILTSEVKWCF